MVQPTVLHKSREASIDKRDERRDPYSNRFNIQYSNRNGNLGLLITLSLAASHRPHL